MSQASLTDAAVTNGRPSLLIARVAPAVGLIALVVLTYLPAFRCGFIWDDPDYVINNVTLRSTFGLGRMWTVPTSIPQYYPLVHTTYWLEFHAWGLSPAGYHVDNALLHAIGVMLLWRALTRLRLPGAWLAAAVWGVHPVGVESVAWVTERKNVLSTALYLVSILCYWRFQPPEGERPASRWPWGWYAAALVAFVLALLSKTVTSSLPAAILLIAWWKRGRIGWRDVAPLVPFFAAGLALSRETAWLEVHYVGATGPQFDALTPAVRMLIAGRAVWFYAQKLLFPVNLIFIYPRWRIDSHAAWQWIFPAAFVAVVGLLWALRKRIGRGPLAATLFFAGTLVPALGFFNIAPLRFSFVADHFQYLASIGLITGAVCGVWQWAQRRGRAGIVAARGGGAVVLIVLVVLTVLRQGVYVDAKSLWLDTVARNPDGWMPHVSLGHIYQSTGDDADANNQYEIAARLAPDIGEAQMAIAGALYKAGKIDAAMDQYNRVLSLDPTYATAHYCRGLIFEERHQFDLAMKEYEATIASREDYSMAHFHRAGLLENQGRLADAETEFRRTVELDPESPGAYHRLADLSLARGDSAEAMEDLRNAARAEKDLSQ